jgi:hypothetical protein
MQHLEEYTIQESYSSDSISGGLNRGEILLTDRG